MTPYAELLEFNQPNPIRLEGFTRIRDQFQGLLQPAVSDSGHQYADPERIIEFAGRWDYGPNSANKLGQPIIQRWLDAGEQSMIEMGHATFFIECSRVVSHELVRHRLASFQQESQRFVSYKDADMGMFFFPPETEDADGLFNETESLDYGDGMIGTYETWEGITALEALRNHYQGSLDLYMELIRAGVPKQIARYVLPNATRTRMIVSANVREWRHIIKLRLDRSAQPEMQELMRQVYDQLVMVFPQSLSGVLDGERGVR